MSPLSILVIDDEPGVREVLRRTLAREGFAPRAAASAVEALRILDAEPVDLVLTDLTMPGLSGLELIRRVRASPSPELRDVPIVMLTGQGGTGDAATAVEAGADDFITKPYEARELVQRLRRAVENRQLAIENRRLRQALGARAGYERLIGSSAAMERVYELIRRVKDSRISCLLLGESGTGKEVVARTIHHTGSRAERPFVPVNCGAIPEGLMESELFGHTRGSFTGATRDKVGFFQAADGGTLFLDEVADLPLHMQVKLLRALSTRRVARVGDVEEAEVDVRVLAATNKDLAAEVAAGRFREDLYYRLNVVRLDIPPLRARVEDIPPLAEHFITEFATEQHKAVRGLDDEARDLLRRYAWPGNVRELRNAMEAAVALEEGALISPRSLPQSLIPQGRAVVESGFVILSEDAALFPDAGVDLDALLAQVEQRYLRLALERAGNHRTRAAELLHMSFRSFRYRLAKYDMDPEG